MKVKTRNDSKKFFKYPEQLEFERHFQKLPGKDIFTPFCSETSPKSNQT